MNNLDTQNTKRKTLSISQKTYDNLVRYGNLSDTFDSTIGKLLKSARIVTQQSINKKQRSSRQT
ncbi:MAG: hypothetical protein DLM72_13230 [Candidatus Nitrosopolaris wilkensis]|nr:MAG: hypothetical protein DLM72_13230 [Candidatus Nitrosopolaris wilkensis]